MLLLDFTLDEDCFTEELLLDSFFLLEDELSELLAFTLDEEVSLSLELDTTFWLEDETTELLDDLSFSLVSLPEDFLSIEEDDSSKSEVSTDELEVPVSSELADDESSQAENASIAKATALHTPVVQAVVLQAKHVGGNHIDVPLELGKGQSAFSLDTLKRSLRYSLHDLGNGPFPYKVLHSFPPRPTALPGCATAPAPANAGTGLHGRSPQPKTPSRPPREGASRHSRLNPSKGVQGC